MYKTILSDGYYTVNEVTGLVQHHLDWADSQFEDLDLFSLKDGIAYTDSHGEGTKLHLIARSKLGLMTHGILEILKKDATLSYIPLHNPDNPESKLKLRDFFLNLFAAFVGKLQAADSNKKKDFRKSFIHNISENSTEFLISIKRPAGSTTLEITEWNGETESIELPSTQGLDLALLSIFAVTLHPPLQWNKREIYKDLCDFIHCHGCDLIKLHSALDKAIPKQEDINWKLSLASTPFLLL